MLRKSSFLSAVSGVVLTILAIALSSPLAKLFVGYDKELYELTRHAFRLFAYSFLLAGFNIFTSSFFTALNNGAVSAAISFMRTLIFKPRRFLYFRYFSAWTVYGGQSRLRSFFAFILSLIFLAKRKKYNYI